MAIEEKLVRLGMDNASFNKKAEESTSIFQKLKQTFSKGDSLSFDKASKSATSLSGAIQGVELTGLQKAVDTVNSRFSVMGEMGAAALHRISNAAINTGQALLNNVVTQPMKDGFGEYELQMKSIQTMLNNVDGATLDSVTNSLDTLNDYADRTIYSFSDMTSAMSKFTLAGIGLEDSQVAIMGLSNLAADAGVQNAQLANAQYQLSQALQAGTVRLMDWRSMENMGLGTKKFREALVAEAQALGTLEEGFDMSTFRDSLKDEWMTTEVVLGVLKDFAEDPAMLDAATKIRTLTQLVETFQEVIGSGWLKTWENIFGNYDESTEFFSNFNDDVVDPAVQGFSDWHNGLSQVFKELGGRDYLIESIYNSFEALGRIMGIIGEAWSSVFPPLTGQTLFEMAQNLAEFTRNMSVTGESAQKLGYILKGVFSAFDSFKTIMSTVADTIGQMFSPRLFKGATDLLMAISELSIGFNESLTSGEGLLGVIESFGPVFKNLGDNIGIALSWVAYGIRNWESIVDFIVTKLVQAMQIIVRVFTAIGTQLNNVFGGVKMEYFTDGLAKMASGIRTAFEGLVGFIKDPIGSLKQLGTVIKDAVAEASSSGDGFMAVIRQKFEPIVSIFQNIVDGVSRVLSTIGSVIKGAIDILSSISLDQILETVGLGASLYRSIQIGGLIKVLKEGLDGLAQVETSPLIKMASALVVLTGALVILAKIDTDHLVKGIIAIGAASAMISSTMMLMKNSGEGASKAAVGIIAMGLAIAILSGPIQKLGSMDIGSLAKGIIAMGAALAMITASMYMMNGSQLTGVAGALIAVGASMILLAQGIKTLGNMELGTLVQGVLGLASVITITTAAVALGANFAPAALAFAAGLGALTLSMMAIVPVVLLMGSLPWETTVGGAAKLAVALGILGAVVGGVGSLLGPGLMAFASAVLMVGGGMALAGIGVLAFATALGVFAASALLAVAAGDNLSQGLTIWLNALKDNVGLIAQVLVELVAQIIFHFKTFRLQIIIEMGQLLLDLLNKVADMIPQFVDVGVRLATGLLQGIAEAFATQDSGIATAITNLLKGIVILLGDVLSELLEGISIAGWNPAEQIQENLVGLRDSIKPLPTDTEDSLRDLGEQSEETATQVETSSTGILDNLKETFSFGVTKVKAAESMDEFKASIIGLDDTTSVSTDNIKSSVGTMLEDIGVDIGGFDMEQLMEDMGLGGAKGLENGLGDLDLEGMFSSLKEQLSPDQLTSLMEGWGIPEPEMGWDYGDITGDGFNIFAQQTGEEMGEGIVNGLQTVIPEVDATAAHILGAFKDGMTDEEFVALGASWGYDFSRGIYNEHGSITDAGVETVLRLEEAINASGNMEAIGEILGLDLSNSLTHHGGQYVTETGAQLMRQLVAGMSEEDLTALTALLGYDITEALKTNTAEGAREAGTNTVEEYAGGVGHSSGTLKVAGNTAGTAVREGINEGVSADDGTVAASLTSVVTTALDAITANIEAGGALSAGTTMMNKLKEGIESVDLTTSGTTQGNQYQTGIESVDAEATGTTIATAVESGTLSVNLFSAGRTLGQGFANGVSNTQAIARAAGRNIAEAAKAGAGSVSAFSAGRNFAEGFANGIRSGAYLAQIEADAMASAAKRAAERAIDARSPARELIKVGGYFSSGMAIGIKDKAQEAIHAARNMATDSMNALRYTAMSLMQKINDDLSMNPVITPVLDDSNIRNVDLGQNEKLLSLNAQRASQYGAYTDRYLRGLNPDTANSTSETVIDIDINNPSVSSQTDLEDVKRQIYDTVDEAIGNKLYSRRRGQAG